jgi:hypothetical protein
MPAFLPVSFHHTYNALTPSPLVPFHTINNLTLLPRHPPISRSPLCSIYKPSLLTTCLLQTSLPLYKASPTAYHYHPHWLTTHNVTLLPHHQYPYSRSVSPLCRYPSGTVWLRIWKHYDCSKHCYVSTKLPHGFIIQKNLHDWEYLNTGRTVLYTCWICYT